MAVVHGTNEPITASIRASGVPVFAATDVGGIEQWLADHPGGVIVSIGTPATASLAASVAALCGGRLVHCGLRTDPWSVELGHVPVDEALSVARRGKPRTLRLLRVDSTANDAPALGLVVAAGGAAAMAADLLAADSLAAVAGAVGRRLFNRSAPQAASMVGVAIDGTSVACDALLATTVSRVTSRLGIAAQPRFACAAHPVSTTGAAPLAWVREGMRAATVIELAEAPMLTVDGRVFATDRSARVRIGLGPLLTVLTR